MADINTSSHRHPPLPPYLGGWAIASLAFTSPIVLSLILVIMRLILAISSANASVENAKLKLASSCLGLEQAASVAVSFPHYLAGNMNNVTADGAEALVHGLSTVLDLSVLAVEQILVFVVDMYRSMYLCLVELVVRGGMALAIGATEEFTEFYNGAIAGLRSELQNAVSTANSALDAAVDVVNAIPGVDIDSPDFTPNLDFLNNAAIPSSFLQSLTSFNESLPTLDELKTKMNSVIEGPFESLRREIAANLGNVTVDRDTFPVPDKENLAFCQELDYGFVDDVGHTLVKVAQYGIIAIIVFIVLYISAIAFLETRWFADLKEYVDDSRATWTTDMIHHHEDASKHANSFHRSDVDRVMTGPMLLGFIGNSRNPLLRTWLPKFMNRVPPFKRSPRARSNLTWFVSYITYLPALLLLAMALLGLLSIEIQLAALKPTEKTAQDQVNTGLASFKGDILAQINSKTAETSRQYANGSNTVLLGMQNGINEDMFGWVDSTTTNINTTINEFYSELTGAISSTFQNTVFATPALGVVNCLIGTKIEAVSKALTWLHDNAHVTLPTVKDNIFMLTPDKSEELVSSINGGNPQDPSASDSIVQSLVGQYRKTLEKERTIFLIMLGLYGLVVVFGLLAILWNELLGPRWRRRRGGVGLSTSPRLKEFQLEKSASIEQGQYTSSVSHNPREGAHLGTKVAGIGASLAGAFNTSLSRLNRTRSKRQRAVSDLYFTDVRTERLPSIHPLEMQQRTFSPPPAYPRSQHHPSTLSLLGEQHHLDASVRQDRSMGEGIQPPSMPLSFLYGSQSQHLPPVPPLRPFRPASLAANPFKTPFDGPGEQ